MTAKLSVDPLVHQQENGADRLTGYNRLLYIVVCKTKDNMAGKNISWFIEEVQWCSHMYTPFSQCGLNKKLFINYYAPYLLVNEHNNFVE